MVRTQAPLVERMTLVWHDWFATSKAGVPQRLMLRQNALLRRHALGQLRGARARHHARPGDAAVAQRHVQQRAGTSTRTTRASCRSCSASAPAAATRERDVRQLARALTGFRNDWTDAGPDPLPLRQEAPRRRAPRASTASAASSAGRRACGWSRATAATPSSWSPSSGATSSRPSRRRRRSRRCRALYVATGREVRPLLEAILAHPRPLRRGRRMVKPPVVQAAGCCAPSAAGSTPTRGRGCATAPASTCSCRPTSPAGTTRAGWTPRRSARAGRWRSTSASPRGWTRTRPPRPVRPGRRWSRRGGVLGLARDLRRRCARGLERYAADTLAAADASWKQHDLPGAALNALRMLVATSPDYLTS